MLILIVAGGPEKGRIYELSEDEAFTVGREGEGIRLSDRKASRKHARLWSEGGKWYVRDLNSRHGTHINGEPIDNQVELNDGDHLQIGKTLFVLARMPVEQAERLALLGDVHGNGAATGPLPTLAPAGRSRWLYAGAAAAAAVVIGSNVAIYMNSLQQAEQLRLDIAQAKAAAERSSQQVIETVAAATPAAPAEAAPDPMLREILAAVQAQREGEKLLAEIRDSVARLPAADELAETLAAKLAPDGEQTELLRSVLAKLDERPQTPGATETVSLLKEVLAKLDAPRAAEEGDAATNELLQGVLAKLDAQPEVAALVDEVRAVAAAAKAQQEAIAAKSDATDALLRETLAQVRARPQADFDGLAAALREATEQTGDGNALLLEQVLANLEAQQALAEQVRELRGIIEAQPAATRAAMADIVKSMPTGDDGAVLAAIADLRATLPADAGPKLDEVLARLDATAGLDQLATAVKTVVDESQAASAKLDAVAARLDAQPSMAEIVAAVQEAAAAPDEALASKLDGLAKQLAEASASRDASTRRLLDEVLAEVRNRGPLEALHAEVTRLAEAQKDDATLAKLAEMRDLMMAWPGETEAMLQEMLAAVQPTASSPADPAVEQMLHDLKQRALARTEEMISAIRHDLRAELSQTAGSPTPASALAPPVAAAAVPQGRLPRSAVLAARMDPPQADPGLPPLSETERAYKLAFETGQPVSIGAGLVNAATGEVAEGRTLDPAAARAAGIKHWREWYLMDDFAERMRLQKQSMRYREANRAEPNLITLPPSRTSDEITVNAMPGPEADPTGSADPRPAE